VFKEYKRPKDALPHDEIMRSEGIGGVAHNKQNAKQGRLCRTVYSIFFVYAFLIGPS
jgi:hypothetical protein